MTNRTHAPYVGVTNDLARGAYEHKHKLLKGFTSCYGIDRLVYFEQCNDVRVAILREKRLKAQSPEGRVDQIGQPSGRI
jgi:putative endonuclease